MALGTAVRAGYPTTPPPADNLVITTPLRSQWVTIVDNGGPETQDAAAITDPDAEIVNSTTHILKTGGRGSKVAFRLKYDDGNTSSADAILQVFGRYSSDEQWQALYTIDSTPALAITIATAETADSTDGTDMYTDVDDEQTVDLRGCDEVLVGVIVAYAVSVGDATLASLEAKVY